MFPQTPPKNFKARRIAGVALLTATGWLGACSDQAGSPNEPEPVSTLPAHEVKLHGAGWDIVAIR